MKPLAEKQPTTQSLNLSQSPNERAGISPVTVRRLMADHEHNYYHAKKARGVSRLESRGLGMTRMDVLPPGGPAR